ncbi:MAG: MerR family transcriptional regulator [Halioglobus sp.]|jgi:hypothetical protein
MQQDLLEPRPLYGIGTVARLTGLKPDTLRVWERRYGLGASHKSATGRRQYTQADLEHLQLVAALVASGVRIGEIAASERKTLEIMVRSHGMPETLIPEAKPRVVFLGPGLCDWLEQHQGCLAHVDAHLARVALTDAEPTLFSDLGNIDMLVVECSNLGSAQVRSASSLAEELGVSRVLVNYQYCNERWLRATEDRGYTATSFPPDPAYLAYEMSRSIAEKATGLGEANLGELMASRPRRFSEDELSAARSIQSGLNCECPRHITDLIRALASFEEYSATCSVENWHDAAVHSCIYAYTGQARWLMEKALGAVLEEHADSFAEALRAQRVRRLNDAA